MDSESGQSRPAGQKEGEGPIDPEATTDPNRPEVRSDDPDTLDSTVPLSTVSYWTGGFATTEPDVSNQSADATGVCLTTVHRYRLIRPLAAGGLGEVLLARDEMFGREVALKHIHPRLGSQGDLRDRFLVEAQITGNLEHPGIVGIYAIGEDAGQPFYVMRLIRGESLKEAIRRYHDSDRPNRIGGERTFALRKLLNRLIDVCNAIAFAHSRGVLHRDIKPANIMIGKYGETLVVDWGLAKRLYKSPSGDTRLPFLAPEAIDAGELTASGHVVGTPAYMSPEQAEGRQDLLEPTSDVYGLGATLYHLLTGRVPIQQTNVGEVIAAARKGDFPPPGAVRTSVDPALEAICLKAMAHDPDDRYATASALADDLERWLADEPVVAYRDPPGRALSRWLARHPAILIRGLAAVVGLLVVALSGMVLSLYLGGSGSR